MDGDGDFEGLDLQSVEAQLDDEELNDAIAEKEGRSDQIVLAVLDGSTEPDHWISLVEGGSTLVLCVDGDLNELAAAFARDIKAAGGELVHFRGFLIITPPGVEIDTDHLE